MSLQFTDPPGTNDGLTMAEQTTVTDNVSIGFWFWSNSTAVGSKVHNGNTGSTGYGISMNSVTPGNLAILFGGINWYDKGAYTLNQWNSGILVANAGSWQIYLNGVALGAATVGAPNAPSGTGAFGCNQAYTATTGVVKVAEAFIYDRVLSSAEITAIGANRYSPLFFPQSLLRYIPMFVNTLPEPTGKWGVYGGGNLECPLTGSLGSVMAKGDHPDILYPGLAKNEGLFRKF